MSGARLPEPWGVRLRRDRPLDFRFEGKSYQGLEGDTLASALLANGVTYTYRITAYFRSWTSTPATAVLATNC